MNSFRAAAFAALALAACNLSNPGFDAPTGELAYPVALSLSVPAEEGGAASHLYVANSNFDLRYNGGSVQSYDLDALQRELERNGCTAERTEGPPPGPDAAADADVPDGAQVDAEIDADPDGSAADPDAAADGDAALAEGGVDDAGEGGAADADVDARVPPLMLDAGPVISGTRGSRPKQCDGRGDSDPKTDPCCFTEYEELDKVRSSEVSIDSYAMGIAVSPDGAHLYVPVRSDSRLVHLDVDERGTLSCGDEEGRCRRGPRQGKGAELDDGEYPALPTAVLSGRFADLGVSGRGSYFVATAHEGGDLSLFGLRGDGSPRLFHTLAKPANPARGRVVSLRMDQGFMLLSGATESTIPRVGARTDVPANEDRDPEGVYLYNTQPLVIRGLTFDQDVRDVMPDARDLAAGRPPRYYALLRGVSSGVIQSVAFLELDPVSSDGRVARVIDAVRAGAGLTRLVQATVGGRHLLFVSCYQDGEIHVIDADARETLSVIRDVVGPTDMQVDLARQLLYVTDVRASVLRVIDLQGLFAGTESVPRVVATLGAPYLPENVR